MTRTPFGDLFTSTAGLQGPGCAFGERRRFMPAAHCPSHRTRQDTWSTPGQMHSPAVPGSTALAHGNRHRVRPSRKTLPCSLSFRVQPHQPVVTDGAHHSPQQPQPHQHLLVPQRCPDTSSGQLLTEPTEGKPVAGNPTSIRDNGSAENIQTSR